MIVICGACKTRHERPNEESYLSGMLCPCGQYIAFIKLAKELVQEIENDSLDLTTEVLRVFSDADLWEGLFWRVNGNEVTFSVMCSDVFYWGTADSESITKEDLPLLQQTLIDLRSTDDACGEEWLPELFCARKRKMRPQRPWGKKRDPDSCGYAGEDHFTQQVRDLFNACGPERDPKDEG